MHDLLKPHILKDFAYIPKDELLTLLDQTDNTYFIDDLNFLSASSCVDCLCGYIPGTDPARNFSYIIIRELPVFLPQDENDPQTQQYEMNPKSDMPIISCRDPEVLEQFLDIYDKNRIHTRLGINTPARFAATGKDTEETVDALLEKYNGYYRRDPNTSPLYDYRYTKPEGVSMPEPNPIYRIENKLFDGYSEAFGDYCWSLYKNNDKLADYLMNGGYIRRGFNCVSFCGDSTNFHFYGEQKPEVDDILYFWKHIAAKFIKEGYTVKSIAMNDGFDNDTTYERMGMEKYRCFTTLITDDHM